ncbi:MAG TPA: hypothetical protein VIF57_20695 [Polyangia bacterium]
MKPVRPQDPVRWHDRDADVHALESRAALLADAARSVQPLAPQVLSRIRSGVVARRSPGYLVFGVPARLALGIGLVVVCATTVGGASLLWRKYGAPRAVAPSPAKAPARIAPPPRVAARTVPVEASPIPVEDPAPAEPATEKPLARARVTRPAARPSPAVVAAAPVEPFGLEPSVAGAPAPALVEPATARAATATEAALIAEALVDLRRRHDARAALARLDRHAREFPHGVLETEALRTRVEAVIQLGDLKTALALLDDKRVTTEALGADLTLTRAELRAAAGRFREALADFGQVVDGASGPLAAGGDERALYGRAICLGRLGQDERARADLLAYQRRFPAGRFASEVRRLLAGNGASRP